MTNSKTMRKLTINQCREMFLYQKISEGMSPKTIRDYTRDTQVFIDENGLNNCPIDSIERIFVLKWITQMQAAGKKAVTINKYLRDVRCFLYWCMEEYNLPRYTIKLVREQEPGLKSYAPETVQKLLQRPVRADYIKYRAYVIIAFLMATGCRASTLINIKMSDIDLAKGQVVYAHTKNKQAQVMVLSQAICKIIREFTYLWDVNTYLICKANGDPLNIYGLEAAVKRYFADLGIADEYKGIHSFRHTFALEYIQHGGGAFQLQQILGHSDLTVTKKYVKLAAADIDISPIPLDKYCK